MSESSSRVPEELLAHAGWVQELAHRLVRNPADADDAIQDTWVAALRQPPRTPGATRAWLGRVVRNFVHQGQRRRAARARREEVGARAEAQPSAASLVEAVERQRLLVDELLTLEEPTREVVLERYFRGKSSAEIARRLGVPAATVRSRHKRGLEQLRRRLDERFGTRETWALAFLLPPATPSLPDPNAQPTASLLKALGAMQTVSKLGWIAGLLLFTAGIGYVLTYDRTEGPADAGPEAPLTTRGELRAAELEAPALEPATLAAAGEPRRALEEVPVEAPVAAPEEELVESEALPEARVEMRFVDVDGFPVEDVRVQVCDSTDDQAWRAARVHRSDTQGRVLLGVPMPYASMLGFIVYARTGFARGSLASGLQSGAPTHLGTIVLVQAGTVRGRVVDTFGKPVPGAWVWVGPESLPHMDAGQLLRRGPDGQTVSPAWSALRDRTDARGRFHLEGVAAGLTRVFAHEAGRRHAWTAPFDVPDGVTIEGVEVTLEALRPEDRIAGRIWRPDGTPYTGHLRFDFDTPGYGMNGVTAVEDGNFDLILYRDVVHDLYVEANDPEWARAEVLGVRPGTLDVEIRLQVPDMLALTVRDPGGERVTRYGVRTRTSAESHLPPPRMEEHPDGISHVALRTAAFDIEVFADGYALGRSGPHRPDGARTAEVQLVPIPGIRGTVVTAGRAVADAQVRLYEALAPGEVRKVNGYHTRMHADPVEQTHTNPAGRFHLNARDSGTYFLRVEAEGHAPLESVAFTHYADEGSSDWELELGAGGTLEVRVTRADGENPAGTIVALSRADPHPRTGVCGEDGMVHFPGLTPGPWFVEARAEEIHPFSRVSSAYSLPAGQEPELPTNCEVFEGRVSSFDLLVE